MRCTLTRQGVLLLEIAAIGYGKIIESKQTELAKGKQISNNIIQYKLVCNTTLSNRAQAKQMTEIN